jgi:hypothetical protein
MWSTIAGRPPSEYRRAISSISCAGAATFSGLREVLRHPAIDVTRVEVRAGDVFTREQMRRIEGE